MNIKLTQDEYQILNNILAGGDSEVAEKFKNKIENHSPDFYVDKNDFAEIYCLLKILETRCINNPLVFHDRLMILKDMIDMYSDYDLYEQKLIDIENEKKLQERAEKTFEVTALQYYYIWLVLANNGDDFGDTLLKKFPFDKLNFGKVTDKPETDFCKYLKKKKTKFELTLNFYEIENLYNLLRDIEYGVLLSPIITSEQRWDMSDVADYIGDIYIEFYDELHPAHEPLKQVQNDNVKLIA